MAGYSGTPLAKKLGIKDGSHISLINVPEHYFSLFTDLPGSLTITSLTDHKQDLVHFFTKQAKELMELLPLIKKHITSNGIIWVSWPKKSSKVPTDLNEDIISPLKLDWSMLRFVLLTKSGRD